MITTGLINFCAKKPLKIIIFFVSVLVLCVVAVFKIPVELMPKTDSKTISITTQVRGGMPADQVENLITIPLEKEFATLGGISHINSVSKDSESSIIINFRQSTNTDTAFLEINQLYEKITPKLPSEIMPATIARYNQYDAPVYIVSLYSDIKTVEEIRTIAENEIKPQLLRLAGIANVEIAGGRPKKIIIALSEKKLIKRGLSVFGVIDNIKKNNQNILAGKVDSLSNSFSVRTDAAYKNIKEIGELIISSSSQKDIIKLKDIAEIKYGYGEAVDIARINGRSGVCLYLQKQSNANTLSVCNLAADKINKMALSSNREISFETVSNKSDFIKKSLRSLFMSLFTGIILAFFIVLLFLREKRTTFFVCLAIPLSLVFSIAALYFSGFTLNINSISGLALGVGMLVDCAIVVTENIARKTSKMKSVQKAIILAVRELFAPLTASTASTVIVFIPMLLADEKTRQLYAPLAAAVTFSLIFSLIIALVLLPALNSKYTPKKTALPDGKFFTKTVLRFYKKILIKFYRHQKIILMTLLTICFLSIAFIYLAPKNISPYGNDNKFTVFVELKSGARLDIADEAVKEVESILKTVPQIKKTIVRIERWSGKIYVTLKDDIADDTKTVMQHCQSILENAGLKQKAFVYLSSEKDSQSKEITLNIYGHDYKQMLQAAGEIHNTIKQDSEFFNFKYRYKPGRPEKVIKVNTEKALLAGFTIRDIAERLHTKIRGLIATEIFEKGKENEIIVRLSEDDRYTLADITNLTLINNRGQRIPLKNITSISDSISPSQIWHLDQKRLIQISFSMYSYTLEEAATLITKYLKDTKLPEKCFYQFDSSYTELKKSYTNLKIALAVMVLFVYMILASVFENYLSPLKIMLTLLFAIPGIAMALFFTGFEFSLGSLNGCMILGGICVNNAIIMNDSFAHIRKKFISPVSAAIAAATGRLRPILLTTLTTTAGLLPLTFKTANSAQIYQDMALTVIFGLTFCSLVILFVFPAILSFKKK